jgi:hypothetical protein
VAQITHRGVLHSDTKECKHLAQIGSNCRIEQIIQLVGSK